jgi:hypothetical protein
MSPGLHLFIELLTLAAFLATAAHAAWLRGRPGAAIFGAMLLLGLVRENAVALREVLYGFAPLHLMLGKAPLIASVVWGFSIYLALVWAELMTGEPLADRRASARLLGAVSLFMIALAWFYEPFLALIEMARWQEGTRTVLDVPLIAMVGYPSLAVAFLLLWTWSRRRGLGPLPTLAALAVLAVGHAFSLQALKDLLGW